jgi:hypothetical protein
MPLNVLSSGYTLPKAIGKARAKPERLLRSGKVRITHFIESFGLVDL